MTASPAVGRRSNRALGWLDDGVMLLLVILAFPLVILALGTPVALLARLLAEITKRL